ncbi:MAG: hypothetical protein HYV42_04660 [Candidatus Magasanikbacteria bacterium]|nr:hypothetical protein [Candidatus Magasanikbacteria bacterium]
MFCIKCGKETTPRSNFCQNCGGELKDISEAVPQSIIQKTTQSANKKEGNTTKILKIIGATILLLIVLQYLVSIFTAIFVALVGVTTEQAYTNVRAVAILISFGIIIYLWIRGYKSIFKK